MGVAVFTSFAGGPTVVVTDTEVRDRVDALAVTIAVPGTTLERRVAVATPSFADFAVEPSKVPSPEILNVRVLVAVVTMLLFMSAILEVMSEVAVPLASMPAGSAVFMSFAGGPNVVVTDTEPWIKPDAAVVTVAVPGVVFDCNSIVPMPPAAFFVVAPSNVPCPDTVKVNAFVAVTT